MIKVKPFIFGVAGTELTPKEIKIFEQHPCEGFILFTRNIASKNQLKALTNSLKWLYPYREVPILIDQEGGRVARLKPPIAQDKYPEASYFSDVYKQDKQIALTAVKANYVKLMKELKKFHIDSPCAPVCDLSHPATHEIIGTRSFGSSTDQVISLAKAAIQGITEQKGIPIIKHIPGHGRSTQDSHLDLPVIDTNLGTLEQTDFKVFQALSDEDDVWGMSAHIIYKALDPNNPATLSSKVIKYIRDKIGFKGKLLTDDINMLALHGELGKKLSTLKKIIKAIEDNQQINLYWMRDYQDYFNETLNGLSSREITKECWKQVRILQPEYNTSLKEAAKSSLEAGCDIVLHCSGNIEEISALCELDLT
ncbi:MAG: hypothetical protein DGJ47_001092 [Rickettsiaceae bacterium]